MSLKEDGTWAAIRRHARREFGPEPDCVFCGLPIVDETPEVDHRVPVALGGDHSQLGPAHRHCNRSAGGRLGVVLQRVRSAYGSAGPVDPSPLAGGRGATGLGGPDQSLWDAAPWLDDLRMMPRDATWPRLMTAPHPRAVDTLGPEFVPWAEARSGRPLRWWQRLVAFRLLEVDADGALVWETLILSISRQSGKSWLLRELCLWRLGQSPRFGEDQLIVHTARDVNICKEVQRPARVWAKAMGDGVYKVREANGNVEIEELATGSRWMVRATESVYGYSATMATVDEAWGVTEVMVSDGLEPTMLEKTQPQLLLVSTAHRRATSLMLDRRSDAITALEEPTRVLLIEWSAPSDSDPSDIDAWRQASPHWTPRRAEMVADKCRRALSGERVDDSEPDPMEGFRSQYLNIWPGARHQDSRSAPLLESGAWSSLFDPLARLDVTRGLWVAVEDNYGEGCAVAAATETDDQRVAVWGSTFDTRAEGVDWARSLVDGQPFAWLILGATLASDTAWDDFEVHRSTAGRSETGPALALLRELVAARRVVPDGQSTVMTDQVESLRVTGSVGGVLIPLRLGRFDLAKAAAWAVQAAALSPGPGRLYLPEVVHA